MQAMPGLPPVHAAVASGSLQALLEAIRQHPEQMNLRADHPKISSATPLHIAAYFGHKGKVQALIDAGADVNAVDGHQQRRTPLHWVIARRSERSERRGINFLGCFKALLAAGSSIAAVPGGHQTAVHCAAACGNIDMLPRLLQLALPTSIDAVDNDGNTALLLAAKEFSCNASGRVARLYQNYEACVLALLTAGASPTAAGRDGCTALHWIAGSGWRSERCLKAMLRRAQHVLAQLRELEQAATAQPGEQRARSLGAVGKQWHGGDE